MAIHTTGPDLEARIDDLLRTGAAQDELARFEEVRLRRFRLLSDPVWDWLAGKSVLVVGGTGCIGSHLVELLSRCRVRKITSVSRGNDQVWGRLREVRYRYADIRDADAISAVLRDVRPDIVFNCAALRSPALAETRPEETFTTNVFGALNLLDATRAVGCDTFVHASTGKTVRLHTSGMYASSKKVAEWLLAEEARRDPSTSVAMARFTHVVDNSLILDNLVRWSKEEQIRLHDAEIAFYGQSAREAAHLMLAAGMQRDRGRISTVAIRDLGWPFALLSLAVAIRERYQSDTAIRVVGYDPGYDEPKLPMLYDPFTAGDASPLINILEADRVRILRDLEAIDSVPGVPCRSAGDVCDELAPLRWGGQCPADLRGLLGDLVDRILEDTLGEASVRQLDRMLALCRPHLPHLDARDLAIHDRVRWWREQAAVLEPVPA